MKHIKKFEKYSDSWYKVGDYILLLDDDIHRKWRVELQGYIYEVYYNEEEREYQYHVEGKYRDNNEPAIFWVNYSEIERRMTPEEIENYKISKEANKYNL